MVFVRHLTLSVWRAAADYGRVTSWLWDRCLARIVCGSFLHTDLGGHQRALLGVYGMKQIIMKLSGYKGRLQELSTVSRPINEKTSGATSGESKESGERP